MSLSNFQVRLMVVTLCVLAIILININYPIDEPGGTPEFFKLMCTLIIVCTLGMWAVNRLNAKIHR